MEPPFLLELNQNKARSASFRIYWRERNQEVEFVVLAGRRLVAIEVKSGCTLQVLPGIKAFNAAFKPGRLLLAGGDGIPLGEFLSTPLTDWLGCGGR